MYRFLSPRPLHYYSYPNLCYRYYDNNNESYSKAKKADRDTTNNNNNYNNNHNQKRKKYSNNDTVVKMPKLPHSCVVPSVDRYSESDHFSNDFCNVTVKRRFSTTTTSAYAPPLTEQKLIIKVQQRFF